MDAPSEGQLECDGSEGFMHTKRDGSWWENDARGIPLRRVCSECKEAKLARYRPEVLRNPNYHADEPIEPEGF
jgi:hypothetical protein